jgi:hypothetical protein
MLFEINCSGKKHNGTRLFSEIWRLNLQYIWPAAVSDIMVGNWWGYNLINESIL